MQQGESQEMITAPFTRNDSTTMLGKNGGLEGGVISKSLTDHKLQLRLQRQQKLFTDAEVASPISTRPPETENFDEELMGGTESGGGSGGGGGFQDEDGFGGVEEIERGSIGGGGNRWPRQETIALLKIRSDMDASFRDATLKGPLWEDVSRKLAELGYMRSSKKCKEKFENVQKYYKRTKEGRLGRQHRKSYRFFTQLEALQPTTTTSAAAQAPVISMGIGMGGGSLSSAGRIQPPPTPSESAAPPHIGLPSRSDYQTPPPQPPPLTGISGSATAAGISFSSNTSSSSADSHSDEDELEQGGPSSNPINTRKRKRGSSRGGSASLRMMNFFEGLMKQVMEKQEAMQQRFLETIEKREQDRMIREEAWKRQEMVRLTRENEMMAQERAISASRDAAVIAFLQKITGQTIQLPPPIIIPAAPPPPPQSITTTPKALSPPPPPPPQPPHEQQQKQHHHHQVVKHQPPPQQHHQTSRSVITLPHQPSSTDHVIVAIPEQQHPPAPEMGSGGFDSASSRWPKQEVLALIKLRSNLESRYQEAGPKGPLWEEISAGMYRMGYNRNSKRCKEKWENINKYFKKVKESNKKRPEDAKTCPYFHQLDALYQKKLHGVFENNQTKQEPLLDHQDTSSSPSMDPNQTLQAIRAAPSSPPQTNTNYETAETNIKNNNNKNGSGSGRTTEGASTGIVLGHNKPEDIMKELMKQRQNNHQQQQQLVNGAPENSHNILDDHQVEELEENDMDELDEDDDDDDDDEDTTEEVENEDRNNKMNYKIEFQNKQNTRSSNGEGNAAAASTFLAMVQ